MSGVPTATGDVIPLGELGFTLPVELIIQESPEMSINWPDYTWAALPDEQRMADVIAKLTVAAEAGVNTIVDRTIPGINRNVPRMKVIAQQVPVNILILTGWYTRYEFEYYFRYREAYPEIFTGELTFEDFLVRDVESGIADTEVRAAGIKCVSDYHGINETIDVRNVFRHCARAHRRTGAPIMTHTSGVESARDQADVLDEEGVDLSRVALCHIDRTPADVAFDEFERLLQRGPFLSFDGWWGTGGRNPVRSYAATREQNIDRVVKLVELGYEEQLLLSNGNVAFTDCLPSDFVGEYVPYTQLSYDIIPTLKERGIGDNQIEQLTVANPRRLFESLEGGGY